MKRNSIFGQYQRIIPLGKYVYIFRPLKTLVSWSKIYSFLSRIQRNDLIEHNFFKNTKEKKFEIWAKQWINLVGKGRFFGPPQNITFLV